MPVFALECGAPDCMITPNHAVSLLARGAHALSVFRACRIGMIVSTPGFAATTLVTAVHSVSGASHFERIYSVFFLKEVGELI
jgi:hypothetical protein